MNLPAYAGSELVDENAVVRALTGDAGEGGGGRSRPATWRWPRRYVLRRKVLIGLADGDGRLAESSLERFERYLGRFDSIMRVGGKRGSMPGGEAHPCGVGGEQGRRSRGESGIGGVRRIGP